jgi:hypothetical protein
MIIELFEWLWEHWEEVTLNALLLFILRKFILTEIKLILRIGSNDTAVLANLKVIMRELGVEKEWSSHEHGLNFMALRNSKKWLPMFMVATQKQKSISRRKRIMDKLKSRKLWMAIFGALLPIINEEFNLGLNTDTVIASVVAIVGYVLGQAHVDAKKVGVDNVKPTIDGSSDK